jgi:hypothetical protein
VSSQLGNRVQHALRAFTPREQRAVKAAAETFRPNPALNAEKAILELGTGEALVSFLEGKGEPSIVQRTLIRPPSSQLGPLTEAERKAIVAASPLAGKYDHEDDNAGAYGTTRKPSASRLRGRSVRPQAGSSIACSGQRSEVMPCQTRTIDWRRHPEERLTLTRRRLCSGFVLTM